jgi:sugar/nucleoside kinase (ribokinase family)
MGVDVRFVARVGAGDIQALGDYFASFGVEPALCGDTANASGVLITIVDPDGERSFLTDRGANLALSSDDLTPELLDGVRLVVVSGYCFFAEGPRKAVMALCGTARARDIPVAVDPASVGFLEEVGVANFLTWTSGATTIFANEAEAQVLTGAAELEGQMRDLGTSYKRAIIKRGAAGAAVGDRSGVALSLDAPQVEVLDTTDREMPPGGDRGGIEGGANDRRPAAPAGNRASLRLPSPWGEELGESIGRPLGHSSKW